MQRSDERAAAIAAEIARTLYEEEPSVQTLPLGGSSTHSTLAVNAHRHSSETRKIANGTINRRQEDGMHRRCYDDSRLEAKESNTCDNDHENENNDDDDSRNDNKTLARSRERNREHARRTRKRKKAQLEALQEKAKSLQFENQSLKQSLEECSIASILVGLSFAEDGDGLDATIQSLIKEASELERRIIFKSIVGGTGSGKRKRFVSDASDSDATTNVSTYFSSIGSSSNNSSTSSLTLKLEMNGKTALFGGGEGRSHINWKNGVYTDENRVRSQLTKQQLESLRRERNRIHAKMTRDRKKSFIATILKTINDLESSNQRMRTVLKDIIQTNNICVNKSLSLTKLLASMMVPPTTSTLTSITSTSSSSSMKNSNDVTPCSSPSNFSFPIEANTLISNLCLEPSTLLTFTKDKNKSIGSFDTTTTSSQRIESNDSLVPPLYGSSFLPPKKRIVHGFSLQL